MTSGSPLHPQVVNGLLLGFLSGAKGGIVVEIL